MTVDERAQRGAEKTTQSPHWPGVCPKCGGPAVYAMIGARVVGACNALTVPCYWSADGDEAEQATRSHGPEA